jgi:hypothetical protein
MYHGEISHFLWIIEQIIMKPVKQAQLYSVYWARSHALVNLMVIKDRQSAKVN